MNAILKLASIVLTPVTWLPFDWAKRANNRDVQQAVSAFVALVLLIALGWALL